jgi:Tfp pilus assembly protein PilO
VPATEGSLGDELGSGPEVAEQMELVAQSFSTLAAQLPFKEPITDMVSRIEDMGSVEPIVSEGVDTSAAADVDDTDTILEGAPTQHSFNPGL